MALSMRLMLALALLAVLMALPETRADRTPTLRKWREFVYGKVRYDGVEYFDFEVTEDAFRAFITFDLGELSDGMGGPTMLLKYGSFPTTSDFDQKLLLTANTTFYQTKIDNLRIGRYYVALVGSRLYDSLMAFVGGYEPLFYFINVYYFGCSDPTRAGSKCSVPMLPAEPVVTPTTASVSGYYQSEGTNTGCIDKTNTAIYYTLDVPAAEWDLTLTLTTSSKYDLTIAAGANLREPADVKMSSFSQLATIAAATGERSVDLHVAAPRTGTWAVAVYGSVPSNAVCESGTGVSFTFVAKHNRDCSHIDGGVITPSDKQLAAINLCSLTFTPLSEIRYHPFKDGVVLDADFEAEQPLLGGNDGKSTAATTQPVVAYFTHIPKVYAGADLIMDALVTANIKSFQIYARVDAYPTASLFDYHFNSSELSDAARSGNTSADWVFEVLEYKWTPVVFPRVGTWYLFFVADGALAVLPGQEDSKNSSFWAVDLSLHTYGCPDGTACSGHGDCEVGETYQGLHYGMCSCHYGFGGEQCDTLTVETKFRKNQIFLLLLSNAAILPVTFLCCRRKLYLESVLFFMTGLTSAVYHACDVEVACLFPYKFLQQMDFALSFNMIMMLAVHFSGARKEAKAGIEVFLLIATIVLATNNATAMANWVLIGAFCVLQFSVTILYYFVLGAQRMGLDKCAAIKIFLFRSDNFEPRFGMVGLALWIAALGCWFSSSPTNYWLIHSVWHIGAMLAAACLIGFRRNDRYQMLTPGTRVDVLGRDYNATLPAHGLKEFAASKVITIASEQETSAVETSAVGDV